MNNQNLTNAHRNHPRHFGGSKIVYPVLSRRSNGISVGINLNPEKNCNFNCVYCQVDRNSSKSDNTYELDLETMERELRDTLELIRSDRLFDYEPFNNIPAQLQRLNDFAFSGDGEPTAVKDFLPACEIVAGIKSELDLEKVKIALITNSTLLDRPAVQAGLEILDNNNGEIWAKLDAGTEHYFQTVNRSSVSFDHILNNILITAQKRPIIIQTLFAIIHNNPPTSQELTAYTQHLNDITDRAGKITKVQLLTTARKTAEKYVTALTENQLCDIADYIRKITNLPIEQYPG